MLSRIWGLMYRRCDLCVGRVSYLIHGVLTTRGIGETGRGLRKEERCSGCAGGRWHKRGRGGLLLTCIGGCCLGQLEHGLLS